jgi:hypothetical protein
MLELLLCLAAFYFMFKLGFWVYDELEKRGLVGKEKE